MPEILIVGAGLSGATVARRLAEAGLKVKVIEERPQAAGNCHTEVDAETGVMTHVHGPHIFHTANRRVWNFVNRFSPFKPYLHRVKAISRGRVYSLPLNLMTLNQLFSSALTPGEAQAKIEALRDKNILNPRNFEEQALSLMGREIYEAFFYGYTKKQWGVEPQKLPAEILKRLPMRFNYEDNYFTDPYQGLPEQGYTRMVENMLDHPHIHLETGRAYQPALNAAFKQVFYSGPLDRYFNFQAGRLPYRTLKFEWFRQKGDYQGCAIINYPDQETPYTRIVEHKHFSYWEKHEATICNKEIPQECGPDDIPYYPVRFAENNDILNKYQALAAEEKGVAFIGRLGAFRYLDMDQAINEALTIAEKHLAGQMKAD